MKYWLDIDPFNEDRFTLNTCEDHDEIFCGSFSALGIEDGDGEWTNKLDDYFESTLGIHPDDWEVG